MNIFKKFCLKYMRPDFLSNFRWYRKHMGGYWVYSEACGWQQRLDWVIPLDEDLFKRVPKLYDYGKQIEDYR